jgi:predicted porin
MKRFLSILLLVLSSQLKAQNTKILDSISFYGMIRVHVGLFDNKIQLQENSPRIGTDLYRKIDAQWTVNGKIEMGLHFIEGVNFNNDANSSFEFVSNPLARTDVLFSRLAYIGMQHKKWGSLSIGKQWGVYYDIGAYTDNLSLFGGSAHGIYAAGTDGGWKGTGRADNAIQYRNRWKNLQLGVQSQLFGDNSSYGVSLQYDINKSITIGASYNDVKIPVEVAQYIEGIGENSANFIAGIRFSKGKYYAAATFSSNDDAFARTGDESVISAPTNGYEMSLGYMPNKRWSFEGGFNIIDSKNNVATLDNNNYLLEHFILGTNYFISPKTRIYLVGRFSDSNYARVKDSYNVLALGFRFNFDYGKKFN